MPSNWRQAVPAAGGKKKYPKGQRGFEIYRDGQLDGIKVHGGHPALSPGLPGACGTGQPDHRR
ncbi:hypothetical protein [Micromonospora lutea]|uniref:Uncharacterized protein n=1 Tax=Micromonospora lutea TaxID=419825 RepID=A0ABQ4IYC2_9ACTN|nr:hypothetical protein [Micromonospora lutea]GIJ22915.1 hypothetical protein Vlu01_35390 [Micromonospora lutea]